MNRPTQTALLVACLFTAACAAFAADPKKPEAKNKRGKKDEKAKGEQPAADSTKVINALCPVEKENAVDPTAPTTVYKGKTVGFCCDDCIKKFERDPDSFAANLK